MYFPSVRKYIVSRFFRRRLTNSNEESARNRLLVVRGYNHSSFFYMLDLRQDRRHVYNWMRYLQRDLEKHRPRILETIKKDEIKQQTGGLGNNDGREALASAIAVIERDPLAKEFALQLLETGDSNPLTNNETIMFIWDRGNQ